MEPLHLRDSVLRHGVDAARRMAATKAERAGVDAAAATLPEDGDDLAVGCLAVTSLPHKGGAHVGHWEQARMEGRYIWQGGAFDGEPMGVPYGAKARMMLIYLLTAAIRTGSPVVTVGSSMYEWVHAFGQNSVGGMTYKVVSAHSRRIAVSRMMFQGGGASARAAIGSAAGTVMMPRHKGGPHQLPQWGLDTPEITTLNEDFLAECRRHAVPVRVSALRQISNNSAAIDLYLRLGWCLPRLERSRLLSWSDLAPQFGTGYKHRRHLKPAFVDTLRLVLAVYRDAQVELVTDGLLVQPSPPPIPPRQEAGFELVVRSAGPSIPR